MGFLSHLSPNHLSFMYSTFRPLLEKSCSLGVWLSPSRVHLYPWAHPSSVMGPGWSLLTSAPLLCSAPASILRRKEKHCATMLPDTGT